MKRDEWVAGSKVVYVRNSGYMHARSRPPASPAANASMSTVLDGSTSWTQHSGRGAEDRRDRLISFAPTGSDRRFCAPQGDVPPDLASRDLGHLR